MDLIRAGILRILSGDLWKTIQNEGKRAFFLSIGPWQHSQSNTGHDEVHVKSWTSLFCEWPAFLDQHTQVTASLFLFSNSISLIPVEWTIIISESLIIFFSYTFSHSAIDKNLQYSWTIHQIFSVCRSPDFSKNIDAFVFYSLKLQIHLQRTPVIYRVWDKGTN